jgi:hypothetical protein
VPARAAAVVVEDAEDASRLLEAWRPYPKVFTWLLLHAAELPALPGIVVSRWDRAVDEAVARFGTRFGGRLLVRSDAAQETARAPRGGFVLAVEEAEQATRALLDLGRVVFLLEPASPFDDLYSVMLEPVRGWHEWYLEVVGPGFDASDLKRGDVTPHEQIHLVVTDDGISVRDRRVATDAVQSAVRAIRCRKIAGVLGCDEGSVEHELQRRGETMFVDVRAYPAIPEQLLRMSIGYATRLPSAFHRHGLDDRGVSISLSFLGRSARPVFWDIVMPRLKYVVGDA